MIIFAVLVDQAFNYENETHIDSLWFSEDKAAKRIAEARLLHHTITELFYEAEEFVEESGEEWIESYAKESEPQFRIVALEAESYSNNFLPLEQALVTQKSTRKNPAHIQSIEKLEDFATRYQNGETDEQKRKVVEEFSNLFTSYRNKLRGE